MKGGEESREREHRERRRLVLALMVWASQSQKQLTDCRAKKKMTNWRNRFSVPPPRGSCPFPRAARKQPLPLLLPFSLSLCLCLLLGPFSICLRRVELVDVSSFYDWLRSHLALIFGYQTCVLNSCAGQGGCKGGGGMVGWLHGGLVAWLCLPAVAVAAFAFLRCNLTISSQNCFGVCGRVRLWHATHTPHPSRCLCVCVCVCDLSKVVDLRISVYMKAKVINNFQAKQCRRFSPVHD